MLSRCSTRKALLRKIGKKGRCVTCKPCTFPVIHLDSVDGLKPCRLKILFPEFSLSGLSFPSTFTLFSQKLISAIQAAIMSALKFPIISPAWFNLPLPVPSPCHLSWSSSFFFLLTMLLDLQMASPRCTESTQMPKQSHKTDQELSMMRLKSPPIKKKASETVAPSGVFKKLKSPPAKRKPADTDPLKKKRVSHHQP